VQNDSLLILKVGEINGLLAGREREVIDAVRAAYEIHGSGDTSLPHSTFLRFPGNERNRIIALPAYLGGNFDVAGIKWVSSFPGNLNLGLERASALVVLNSLETGRPQVILEGSVINAKRTAASAALAAQCLCPREPSSRIGVLGCGVISFEIMRFLRAVWPAANSFVIFDLDQNRAQQFKRKCQETFGEVEIAIATDTADLLRGSPLVALATTALVPHIFDLSPCPPEATILNISLRDISADAILSCDNVVDDVDHVCRAQTSVHLAEQQVGHRDFIRCSLPDILTGKAQPRGEHDQTGGQIGGQTAVFSPFGLGILDLAVSQLVYELARSQNIGTVIDSFSPPGKQVEAAH